jgi:hypothetical protein
LLVLPLVGIDLVKRAMNDIVVGDEHADESAAYVPCELPAMDKALLQSPD